MDEKDYVIEELQNTIVELTDENQVLRTENDMLKKKINSTIRISTPQMSSQGEEATPLSVKKIKKLAVVYEKEEDSLIKLFLNNLAITMDEDEKYKLILNSFFYMENEVDKFHKELEGQLIETMKKRARGKTIDALKFKNSSNFRRFSSLYFLLQKKQIVKRVVRKTRIEKSDFLKRWVENSPMLEIMYEFYVCNVRLDETDKHLIGKRFLKNCHSRFANCQGFIIVACVSPALIDEEEGDVMKKALVVTETVQKKRSGNPPGRLVRNPVQNSGGLSVFPTRGGGKGGFDRASMLKAASTINLGGGLIQTEKTREMDMKKREAAANIKEDKIKRKEERLKEREEELKKRDEALTLFEKDLRNKENQLNIDHEERKKEMAKQIEELEKQKKERLNRRKKKIIVVKKKRANTLAMGKNEMSEMRKKLISEKELEKQVEEEEKGCPKKIGEIVFEYMDVDSKFSGLSDDHFSYAKNPNNIDKNRYSNILPYNHNYVNVGKKGYINASDCKIHGIRYFATQWPLVNNNVDCENDWWDMVFRHNCKVIVALQKPHPPKHQYYWPKREKEEKETKKYLITNVSNRVTQNYHEIKVSVAKKKKGLGRFKKAEKSVECSIFVYMQWPDMGLPEDFDSLREIFGIVDNIVTNEKNLVKVKVSKGKTEMQESPIIVHCSAGVGRTGVFIICHSLLRKNIGMNNIKDTLFNLRKQRVSCVQTTPQYQYCYNFCWKYIDSKKE